MDKDNQAQVVDLFHQYRGRLAKLGVTLSTSNNRFQVVMEGTHTRYMDDLDRVISFHDGLQASLDMEAGKREQLIELLLQERKDVG